MHTSQNSFSMLSVDADIELLVYIRCILFSQWQVKTWKLKSVQWSSAVCIEIATSWMWSSTVPELQYKHLNMLLTSAW